MNFKQLNESYYKTRCKDIFSTAVWPSPDKLTKSFKKALSSATNIFIVHGYYGTSPLIKTSGSPTLFSPKIRRQSRVVSSNAPFAIIISMQFMITTFLGMWPNSGGNRLQLLTLGSLEEESDRNILANLIQIYLSGLFKGRVSFYKISNDGSQVKNYPFADAPPPCLFVHLHPRATRRLPITGKIQFGWVSIIGRIMGKGISVWVFLGNRWASFFLRKQTVH